MKYIFLMMILLALPVSAHADWSNAGMRPALTPNFSPSVQHETVPLQRVEPQRPVEVSRPAQHYAPPVANHAQLVRHDQPVNRDRVVERRTPGYFRRDVTYYQDIAVPVPYSDVDTSSFIVPDGFETVLFNGETFYYNQGVFYQQVSDQLTAIPAVLGAVVDYIPQDYQIVMVDGVHYLVTGGVYYQRVDQGFEVVQPPASDLE